MRSDDQCAVARSRYVQLRAWLAGWLALAVLNACGTPDQAAVAPPTATPPVALPATLQAVAPPSATPLPTLIPAALSATSTPETPYPTSAGEPATIVTPAETPTSLPTFTPAPTIELPPTPALPVEQALRQFAGHALLFANHNSLLMLTDGRQNLWLTSDSQVCDRAPNSQGEWSPDGRFLAIACQRQGATIVAILDTQTGQIKPLDVGADVMSQQLAWPHAWSPTAPELVIIVQSSTGSALLIANAATGQVQKQSLIDLGNLWPAVAWSPDGAQIAILLVVSHGTAPSPGIDPGLYVVDTNTANSQYIGNMLLDGSNLSSLAWNRDGRSIVVDESIEDGLWATLVALDPGATVPPPVSDALQVPTVFWWSPDGRYFLVKEWLPKPTDSTPSPATVALERMPHWSLYHAEGVLVHRFSSNTQRDVIDVAWMPDSRRIMLVVAEHGDGGVESTTVISTGVDGLEHVIARYPAATGARVTVAPDGTLLAVSIGDHIVVLNPQGQEQARLEGSAPMWRPQP